MGQSKFKWIIAYEDGETKYFVGTWDELIAWGVPGPTPVAIVRGRLI